MGKDQVIIGVGFLLFNAKGQIFVVEELKSKPEYFKEAGMWSFPLETFKSEDICPINTIPRLIKEEIGFPQEQVVLLGFYKKPFKLIPNRSDILTFYGLGFFMGNKNTTPQPKDDDIRFVGWKSPGELLTRSKIRIEVGPILTDFQRRLN